MAKKAPSSMSKVKQEPKGSPKPNKKEKIASPRVNTKKNAKKSPAASPATRSEPRKDRTFFVRWFYENPNGRGSNVEKCSDGFLKLEDAKKYREKIRKLSTTLYHWIGDDKLCYIPCEERRIVYKIDDQ